MSDLQCPVTVVFCDPGCLGSARVLHLLDERRPSGLFVCSSAELDADTRSMAGRAACPILALATAVDAATLREAVEQLSDLHRGETLIVVAPTDWIQGALASARRPPVEATIDSDGWIVLD